MTEQRLILEMGSGNDLYGADYTKAACRAVQDALHHSSITMFSALKRDHKTMRVKVTIGVGEPDKVDLEVVKAELPRGNAEVTVVKGGMTVDNPYGDTPQVIATAAVEAFLPSEVGNFRLSK